MSNEKEAPFDFELAWWWGRAATAELERKHAANFCVAAGAAVIASVWVGCLVSLTPGACPRTEEFASGLRAAIWALAALLALLWWITIEAEKKKRRARTVLEAAALEKGFSVDGDWRYGFRIKR